MPLKDLLKPDRSPASDRPPGITCEKYLRGESKRCAHYTDGICTRADEFVCLEWLKANHRPAEAGQAPAPPVASERKPTGLDRIRGFTTEDIENFRAVGVEVLLRSAIYGDIWLVPEYTGLDRMEITPEHAATIARVMLVFPGSYVVSFEKMAQGKRP